MTKKNLFPLALASHELKTPLCCIKAYLDLLAKTPISEKQQLYLTEACQQMKKLEKMIADLMLFSGIHSGALELTLASFDFDSMITETIKAVQSTTKHNIVLIGEADTPIIADRLRLEQAIINILNNAIKYSPKSNKVIVKILNNQSEIKLIITDFGIGVDTKIKTKVFKAFFRENKTASQYPGLGIGLYIAQEIIKKHRGKIWLESQKNKGTEVFLTIPINTAI